MKTSPLPSESMKIWVCHCDLNTTISASKPITNLNCVFISYPRQKWSDLVVNYNKSIVLLSKYWQKWLPLSNFSKESCALWYSCTFGKERKCPVYMSTILLFFQHSSPQKWLISSTFKVSWGEYIGQIDRPFDEERWTYSKLVLNVRCPTCFREHWHNSFDPKYNCFPANQSHNNSLDPKYKCFPKINNPITV